LQAVIADSKLTAITGITHPGHAAAEDYHQGIITVYRFGLCLAQAVQPFFFSYSRV
jgi:hypothetical protein